MSASVCSQPKFRLTPVRRSLYARTRAKDRIGLAAARAAGESSRQSEIDTLTRFVLAGYIYELRATREHNAKRSSHPGNGSACVEHDVGPGGHRIMALARS